MESFQMKTNEIVLIKLKVNGRFITFQDILRSHESPSEACPFFA